mmetsp:Transcript_82868/g.208784  ORF Transcript_82868/g.208784 Transcript_82868/m.208784 type:complete len:213 (-) Transcript_82868:168-806(-)
MVRPLVSKPKFGDTMSRSSERPPASNCGDTRGLPTQSLNFALTLSMRHSTRAISTPSSSFVCTVRLSDIGGRAKPGGGGILSVCDLASNGCSSGTIASVAEGGAVLVRFKRRLRPGGAPSGGSSTSADALDPAACFRSSSPPPPTPPTFFLSSRASLSMSAISLEICPLERSNFWTLELMVCTCVSKAGASWHACDAMSAKGKVLAERPPLE